ncbi:amino acid permease-associated region [Mycolicibacterium phlei]|uniref:Amino acid permease n=1 Tax=Mycolicibacterium phlei DSM 43239 = CCUG 21000 TaxID=1226750 RepID=A0A5N5VDR1_MYCPH|nr:amino acid permease [Mycolicibacterium phlei]VEG11313.1 amino acid permease-associated region [Mycobacteroides chelonae]AMO63216.1 putative amino acid permease YhdG [Mycolicibacterium phlei]KAB7759918.1 amino acid permease [Mycolicibacterium phlei DSM 43239 = CCUG 21000]KXW64285.1 amino acid permease [Mycolicibacterium phlei DSM 43072]KXW68965.1 amino acid permease [Mycolicibacterium phlei DSM 43239 = CCUG 21000]
MSSTIDTADRPQVLRREFNLWSAFAFAFAFISPIVALYAIFGLALTAAGPSFWWGFALVFGGQFLVALVFATLVSRWPLEGSIYQWSRRLLGTGYGWFAGWAYMWTLVIAMATVALGAAGFVANIIGIEDPSGGTLALIALVILLGGTAINLIGRTALKVFMTASIVAEVIGSLGLGTWLLLFHRQQPLSVLFDGGGPGVDTWSWLSGPFLLAVAFIGFSFVGFESAGSIAEEVHEPRRHLPKAVLFSLTFIALVVAYSSLAIILAVPDFDALADQADPVYYTLTEALGAHIAKPVEVLFIIGFLASFLALQTSGSRVIWAYARDGALPGAGALARLRGEARIPALAILVTTVIGAALFGLSVVAGEIYTLMVNFTSGGFYLSFLFPLVGFLVVLLRRQWTPARFSLGAATLPVAAVAVVWAVLQFLNISWPRAAFEHRYLDWSVWIGIAVLVVLGASLFASVRGRITATGVIDEIEARDEEADR